MYAIRSYYDRGDLAHRGLRPGELLHAERAQIPAHHGARGDHVGLAGRAAAIERGIESYNFV